MNVGSYAHSDTMLENPNQKNVVSMETGDEQKLRVAEMVSIRGRSDVVWWIGLVV